MRFGGSWGVKNIYAVYLCIDSIPPVNMSLAVLNEIVKNAKYGSKLYRTSFTSKEYNALLTSIYRLLIIPSSCGVRCLAIPIPIAAGKSSPN